VPGGPLGAPDLLPPPSGDVLQQGLDEWERWIHNVDIPLLMRIAIGHYQFEALHPFIDGNGRMGRLVAQLQLVEGKVLACPILNLSPYLEPRADEYRESLRELRVTGDRDPWLSFFLNAMLTQAEVASHRTQSLLLLRDELIDIVKKQGIRGVAVDIAGGLIGVGILQEITREILRSTLRRSARVLSLISPDEPLR
jgi:Fic family protein